MEGDRPIWLGAHPGFSYSLEAYTADLLAAALSRSGLTEEEFTVQVADLSGRRLRREHVREWLRGSAVPPGRVLVAALVLASNVIEMSSSSSRESGTLEAVKRREFLKKAGRRVVAVGAGAALAQGLLDDGALSALDDVALAALRRRTRMYAREASSLPFWYLEPSVREHLALLHQLLLARQPPLHDRELRLAVAEAAILTGWLSYFMERRLEAQAYWTLADTLSKDAGDGPLRAYALTSLASLYSGPSQGRQRGDPELAITLLNEASRRAGSTSSPYLRAYVWARRAEEHAAAGRARRAHEDIDRGDRAVQEGRHPDDGFFSDWSPARLAGYRGNCAVLLERPAEAISVLEAALIETPANLVPQRAGVLADLGAAYAHPKVRQIDQSCALLSESLLTANRGAALERVQRVSGIRERYLQPWEREPAVRRLDEQLAGATASGNP
jgi:tetratricopeptide (TPR) repeat protein